MERTNQKLEVHLDPEVRGELETLCRKGGTPAAQLRRARVLLLADEDHVDGRRPDRYIAEVLAIGARTVVRIRQRFVREGIASALARKSRAEPATPFKLDGQAEAQLVALCCSTPPSGRSRWTLHLLADELCRLQVVVSICPETVRRCLKKIASSPGKASGFALRNGTAPGSSRTWKKSSMSTAKRMTASTR